jgi:ABC-type transport system involved in multi-copper enzyme maturation permease subunit
VRSFGCIAALAGNTVREAVRNRILYVLLVFSLILIGAGVLVGSLSYVESDRILQDIGLAAIRLLGVALAIFVGIQLIYKEVERKTVYTILSKPISRAEFLLGKFLGLTLTIWLLAAIMMAAFCGISLLTGAPLAAAHAAFFALMAAELALVVAIATLFSAFTTPMLAALFTTGTWMVGQLTRDLRDLGAGSESPALERATALLHRTLPDLESFDLAIEAAHQLPVTASDVALPLVYGAGYLAVVLLLAILLFDRRDFR